MTEATANAAPVDTALLDPLTGQELVMDEVVDTTVDSAPTDDAPIDTPTPAPAEDGFQKRINKVTADKYAEKRRADDLAQRVKELEAAKAPEKAPTLEDFDFDDDAYRAAIIQKEVQAALGSANQSQQEAAQQAAAQQVASSFGESIAALGHADFDEVANRVPLLPEGVASALMQSDEGAKMIYHLGSNPDVAEQIANLSPMAAMAQLGKISVSMATQPTIKHSAAPDPIAPLRTGAALSANIGDEMPINEWMAKFNG